MNEFKDIVGWEGYYEINSSGVVRSKKRLVVCKNGVTKVFKGKTIKSYINQDGYRCIKLCRHNVVFTTYVHRLLAATFIPNTDNKPMVNHKDGVRLNISLDNLEWCTQSENMIHSYRVLGQKPSITMKGRFGKLNPASKPLYQFSKGGELIKEWESLKMATDSGFDKKSIYLVINGVHRHHKGYVWKR